MTRRKITIRPVNRVIALMGIVLLLSPMAACFVQNQHEELKTGQHLEITKEELLREMFRLRWSVFKNTDSATLDANTMNDTLLWEKAIKSLLVLKVHENLLRERNLWPFKNYNEFLRNFHEINDQRIQAETEGITLFGPTVFSEETFYDYLMSNALIKLKQRLVTEGEIKVSASDLQKQFEEMKKDAYAKEKYTLKEYKRQVNDAVIELKFSKLIASYVDKMERSVDAAEWGKVSLRSLDLSNDDPTTVAKEFFQNKSIHTIVYVDAENGNDKNDGLTPATAWLSLDRINQTTFAPGAKILLKAGSRWIGELHPKGSGSALKPIIINRYGSGPKPLIDGNGLQGRGVVRLYNQEYWEINNLEIVNNAPEPGDRRGVEIKAENYGVVNHIYLKNLRIHHIKGIVGNGMAAKRTAGIFITTVDDRIKPTRYNNIRIEECHIHDIDNQGIAISHEVSVSDYPGESAWEKRKLTNLIVRNNIIHHISKNAMIIRMADKGVVERNLCYETALGTTGNTIFSRTSKGTVFQYNEGFLNRSLDADGSLYDPDINSPETIWQYSYSHDNAHGLVWFCTDERDKDIIIRYNVSENDKGALVYFNYDLAGALVYNNVFYIGEYVAPLIIREKNYTDHKYEFYNNIIYNKSPMARYAFATSGNGIQDRTFSNNIFYGFHPDGEPLDDEKITDDPLFVDPGKGDIFNRLNGYELKRQSPALRSGKRIENNGGQDFFGNKIFSEGKPNRGVYDRNNN